MLARRGSGRRDWAWFALLALLPVAAVALLGLRAARNEEAAAAREMALALERHAQRVQASYERTLAALAEAPMSAVDGAASPEGASFAEAVVLDADGTLRVPAPAVEAGADEMAAPQRCRELSRAIASSDPDPDRHDQRRVFLQQCEQARSPTGRYLWLVLALDDASRGLVEPAAIEAWLERHRDGLSAPERAATLREVRLASWLGAARQRRLEVLLAGPRPTAGDLAAILRAQRAFVLRKATAEQAARWQDERSAGAVRQRPDGSFAGFVVHRGSIERALAAGWPELPPDMSARLSVGALPGDAAVVRLLEGPLVLVLSWSDETALADQTRTSLLVLLGTAATALIVALGLAALLFARIRRERRLGALRTDFVAAVSHELRTPIASLRMLAELLAEERVPAEERAEVVTALAREARRLGNTVHRLLTFSRMEGGRAGGRRAEGSVTQVARSAVATFAERHRPVMIEGPPAAPEVLAPIDEEQLAMALDNLLENARKYAPQGQPYEVTVRAVGDEVLIAVRDRGPGIVKADQQRIFEPFERADDRLSEATEGSGIGLSLVRHVARSHGGRAWVESEGGGATFVIALPRSEP